jgi:osmoprotectant transport system ATP-binding protein
MNPSSRRTAPALESPRGAAKVRGAAVEFQHVSVQFDSGQSSSVPALNDLSLTIPPGTICVLVGPSGCGKTTTLRLVNRLLQPTRGRVLIDGRDVAAMDPVLLRRRIGYVIQQIGLFPHQTVAQNVATVPRLLQWPADRIRRRVDDLLALIGLDPAWARDRYPAQLSGGERQRVGVARALAAEPPLLLMDEPFAAVDPIVREHLQDEFVRLQRALSPTVLFVTHDVDEAIRLGTHVAVMREGGRLAQLGSPGELLASPADDYVARFVGADRALKRLTLMTAGALACAGPPPDASMSVGELPTVRAAATARDALAAALTSPARGTLVVDGSGRRVGVVTIHAIAAALAAPAAAAAPVPAEPAASGCLVGRGAAAKDHRDTT